MKRKRAHRSATRAGDAAQQPGQAPPAYGARLRMRALASSLERLSATRANSRLGLICDIAVAVVLLGEGIRQGPTPVGATLVCLAGLVVFSFVEYAFHRWLFHGSLPAFERGHRKHHEQPLGYDSLPFFLPPLAMLALAALLATLLPVAGAMLFTAALATGYALYGLSHWIIHARRFRSMPARRWAAVHHVHHHHADTNFGVTTAFWDIVFGTRYSQRRAT